MPRKTLLILFLSLSFCIAGAQTYHIKVNNASGKVDLANDTNTWFRSWYSTPKVPGEPTLWLHVAEDYNNMGFYPRDRPNSIVLFSGKFTEKSTYELLVVDSNVIRNFHFRARAISIAQRVQFADTLVTFDQQWQEFDFSQEAFNRVVRFELSGSNTGLEVQMSVDVEKYPAGEITFFVVDTLGNVRATETLVYPAGKTISRLPSSLRRDFVRYDNPEPCIVAADERRIFTVVSRDSLPLPPSAQGKYYLCFNNDWPVCADGRYLNAMRPTPDLVPDLWEVSGDQYSGIRLRHVATGLYLDRVIRECYTCSYASLSDDGCRWRFCDHYGHLMLRDDGGRSLAVRQTGVLFLYAWGNIPEFSTEPNIRLVPAETSY